MRLSSGLHTHILRSNMHCSHRQPSHNWVAMTVSRGVPDLIGRVAQQAVIYLEQVCLQVVVRVFLAGSDPFTVQVQNEAVSVRGHISTLGTDLADLAWGALGQRDQKWVSS